MRLAANGPSVGLFRLLKNTIDHHFLAQCSASILRPSVGEKNGVLLINDGKNDKLQIYIEGFTDPRSRIHRHLQSALPGPRAKPVVFNPEEETDHDLEAKLTV